MELTERYIYAVTKCLPASQRKEVADDLRGMIEDMAQAKAKKESPSDADYKAVLTELGAPEKMALEYGKTNQYLIGPRYYDMFLRALKHVLLIAPPIVALIVSMINIVEAEPIIKAIIGGVGAGLSVAIHVVFWVIAVFVVLERTGVKLDGDVKSWNVENLPELPKKRQVSVVDSVAGIVMILIFMGAVVFASSQPAWWTGMTESLLNPGLWNGWVQGFLALSVASLLLEIAKLRIGNWIVPLVVVNVFLAVAWAVFISIAVLTQTVVNPEFITEVQANGAEGDFAEAARWTAGMAVAVAIGGSIWSAVESIYKAVQLKRG